MSILRRHHASLPREIGFNQTPASSDEDDDVERLLIPEEDGEFEIPQETEDEKAPPDLCPFETVEVRLNEVKHVQKNLS